jgi:hypothetical protein
MSRATLRLLAAIVLRALGATLLTATVLLPAADHHALARLSLDVVANAADPHDLLVHHHRRDQRRPARGAAPATLDLASPDVRAVPAPETAPRLIAPAPAGYQAAVGGSPIMDAVALGVAAATGAWLLGRVRSALPPSRTLPVRVPPPRPTLLLA